MKILKPLRATKVDLNRLKYPVACTPKLDGIRCIVVNGEARSKSGKPIPNLFVQEQLKNLHGTDGELMVSGNFDDVSSAIMSREGKPDFMYAVFDKWDSEGGYCQRIENILDDPDIKWYPHILIVRPVIIHNEDTLESYMNNCLAERYEGIMIRDPEGRYKHGQSTLKEGLLLKYKKFFDDEAEMYEVIEEMTNTNEQESDELGYSKRSSAKEGLVPAGTAGSCVLMYNGDLIRVGFGPGFTAARKKELWEKRGQLKGRLFKFSYQELTKEGKPRFGKLLGERYPEDL